MIGNTSESEAKINETNITVMKTPGSGDIDLSNAVVEVFANGESDTLVHDDSIGEGTFSTTAVTGSDNEALSNNSDRIEIVFGLEFIDEDARLEEGDTITVQITTGAGGTAFVEKRAPESMEEDETVLL